MTLNEFKAWFRGYTEQMGDLPSKEQWARIKEEIEAATILPPQVATVPTVWQPSPNSAGCVPLVDTRLYTISNSYAGYTPTAAN